MPFASGRYYHGVLPNEVKYVARSTYTFVNADCEALHRVQAGLLAFEYLKSEGNRINLGSSIKVVPSAVI